MMNSMTQLIRSAFGEDDVVLPPVVARRRKRLWELPSRMHCPVIGTCLPVSQLRKLARRAGVYQREMSDFTLHSTMVGYCDTRSALTEGIQKYLDKRYAAAVASLGRERGEPAILAAWQQALLEGDDIAGVLWAAWTHPDLDEQASNQIYGDIHMLSHQVGASVRADLRQLERIKQDNMRLRAEHEALRHGLDEAQRQKERAVAGLSQQVADAEQRAALLARREVELADALRRAGDYETLFRRAEAMAQRIESLEERNAGHAQRARNLEIALADAEADRAALSLALETALGIADADGCAYPDGRGDCGSACPAEARLLGRCVLCIGGKTNLVECYRRLVETRGGRFLHHDGGQEDNLHRIDVAVASADAVICQAGCVSHTAYYRLKESCKELGKPGVFLKSPGMGSFARGLAALSGDAANADSAIRLVD